MSVYLTIPSKKPAAEAERTLALWRERGYKLAIWRDDGDDPVACDLMKRGRYPGYAKACVALIHSVIENDPDAEWFICAGDDIEPDQSDTSPFPLNKSADIIGAHCRHYFGGTFGVMQPTGDRWGEDPSLPNLHPLRSAYIDRVAASAWFGKDYCRATYGGWGPLFEGYKHQFVDEEAQAVAQSLGVYWQRPDLTQKHAHWQREGRQMPAYLTEANSPQHWNTFKRLFETRRAAGFPGALPA